MHHVIFFLFIPCLAASGAAVNLSSLAERVRTGHPALVAARLAIEEAAGRQLGAGRLSNPEVALDFRHDNRFREGNLGVSFEQRFPLTARLKLEKKLTERLVDAARLEVAEVERKLVLEAGQAAVQVLAHREKMELTRKQRKVLEELAEFMKARVDEGEISALDEAQVRLEMQRLDLELSRLEAERAQLEGAFHAAMGRQVELSGPLPATAAPVRREKWEERADFQLSRLKEELAGVDLDLAQAKRWEDVGAGLFAEGERHEDGVNGLERKPFFGFRISVPLPLWNKNEGEVEAKRAGVRRSELETKALSSAIQVEISTALAEMKAALKLEKDAREKLLPLVQQQTTALEKAYENGQAELVTVQRAREQSLQVEALLVDAVRDFHMARLRYEAAAGLGAAETQPTKALP